MKNKILLIGGGGHCKSVLDSLLLLEHYDEIGIIDPDKAGSVLGVEVIGEDNDLPVLFREGWKEAFITVGSVGETRIRHKLYSLAKELGFIFPTIIDPSAIIARETTIEEGAFVGKGVIINAGSTIGCCSIINTGSIIEHDCCVGDFSHISPGAVLCGGVSVGSDSHIGAGSIIRQGIEVGKESLVGAGSIVVKNIPNNVRAYGSPCKVVG